MYCPYCGIESQASGALFCAGCGIRFTNAIEGPSSPLPVTPLASHSGTAWVFWVLVLTVVCGLLMHAVFLFQGVPVKPMTSVSQVVWTGFLGAYVATRRRRNGWLGFAVGSVGGYLLLAMVGATYLYANSLKPSHIDIVQLPENQQPSGGRPFVDPDTLPNEGRPAPNVFGRFDPPASAPK